MIVEDAIAGRKRSQGKGYSQEEDYAAELDTLSSELCRLSAELCVGYPRSCVSAIRGVEVPALQKMGVGGHMIFFTHLPVGLQFTFRSNHVTVSSESGVRGHMISFTPVGLHSLSGQTT